MGVEDSNRGLTQFLLQTRDDKSIAAPKTVQAIQTRDEDIRVWVLYSLTDRQTDISLLLEKRRKKKKSKQASTKLWEVMTEIQLVTPSKK